MSQKEERLEVSRNEWKAKNKERYEEIKALKMRLKETIENRNKWKNISNEREKALLEKERILSEKDHFLVALSKELEDLKKNKRPCGFLKKKIDVESITIL